MRIKPKNKQFVWKYLHKNLSEKRKCITLFLLIKINFLKIEQIIKYKIIINDVFRH